MMIPYGLLGSITPYGGFQPAQMPYWDGNRFVIPQAVPPTPPAAGLPTTTAAPAPAAPPPQQPQGLLPPSMFDGHDPMGGPDPSAPPSPEQGIPDAFGSPQTGLEPAGFGVTTPSPSTPAAPPSAPTAPAEGLPSTPAVSEVDPQGPPGSSKGGSKGNTGGKAAPSPATFSEQSKSLAAQVAQDLKGFSVPSDIKMGEIFNDITRGWAPTVATAVDLAGNYGETNAQGGRGDPDNSGGVVGQGGVEGTTAGFGGAEMGGTDGVGGGGNSVSADAIGNDDPSDGNAGWRKGGRVKDDGDGKLEPVRGVLHETEMVIRPESTRLIDKHYPGLLDRLNKVGVAKNPAKALRGLLGGL